MELLDLILKIPVPVLLILVVVLAITTIYMAYQWAKMKGLDGIRMETYKLFLKAEKRYKESGAGQQRLKWVVSEARKLLPDWLQLVVTEENLERIIKAWFVGIKDLLDDGKINSSQKKLE